jgi:hypothetical protein
MNRFSIKITAACLLAALLLAACSVGAQPSTSPELSPEPSPQPSPAPSPVIEPTPEPSPPPSPEPSPEPSPTPHPASLFRPGSVPETDPDGAANIRYAVQADGVITEEYQSPYDIWFGFPEEYTSAGVTTFRGNNFRNDPTWGTADINEETLIELYHFRIGSLGRWTGVGWNGQPSIIQWAPEVIQHMNIKPEKKAKDGLVEVIYATMDGNIYFFDLDDGEFTRDPIHVGVPFKGSVTIDPRGYPILYAGQGDSFTSRFGYYIFSLIDQKELFYLSGNDLFSQRRWPAFDANPIFDTANDLMFLCGENGIVYTIKLNTDYDREAGTLTIDPAIVRYRYSTAFNRRLGMESAPAAFGHYLFTADNDGVVQCIDLKTLKPVWVRYCTDDTDATVVLDWEEDTQRLALYTGNQVDLQGAGGLAYLRKLDASTGALLWEHSYRCLYDEAVNGGLTATALSGKHELSELVIFWVAKLTGGQGGDGVLVCYDKKSGDVVWEKFMPHYGYSSPVAVYTPEGKGYIAVCDSAGYLYLLRGTTGETLDRIGLGANVEGSPAVFGNKLVVGTRGQRIYGIEIR